jgi:tripartite-type tricarboxylate transporter receptor subunit TctC
MYALGTHAFAQSWPNKPIKLIVPYAAGGPADAIARQFAIKMQASLGQPIVVDNRAGAGGVIGVEATVKSAPDGYTLALVANGPLVGMPNLTKTSYSLEDIQFITLLAKVPGVLVVNSKSGFESMAGFLGKAKAQPDKYSYSSSGPGTTPHIGIEIFKNQAKLSMLHVPYKGAAPAMTALLSGEVDLTMVDLLPAIPHIQSGAIKALAIAGTNRSPLLPNVPTTAETGVAGVTMETIYGIIAPKTMPAAIAAQVREAAVAALHAPELKQWLNQQGVLDISSTGSEYQQLMRSESEKWKNIISVAKITVN